MADASLYGEFVKANQPFATLGEIAASKQQRETTRLNQQIAQDTLKLRQQEILDKQKAQQEDAEDTQALSQAFQQHTGPDGPNKKAILQTLYTAGRTRAAQKAEAVFAKALKEAGEAHKLELENSAAESTQLGQLVQGMNPQNYRAIASVLAHKSPEFAQTFGLDPSQPFNPQAQQAALAATMSKKEYLDAQKDILANQKDATKTFMELAALTPDAEHYTSDAWEFAKAHQITDELRGMGFSEQFDPSVSQRARALALGAKEMATLEGRQADDKRMAATAAETARHNRTMEGQGAARLAQAKATGGAGGGGTADDELVATIISEPGLWDQLTPTVKGRIAAKLKAKGYEGFGKPMTESAMKQVAESESAIDSLKDLKETLKKNEQFIGPLAGLQAMNPYSEARKAQANIDLVRQRVGKALEGGVLRKEDEEKYKKILATLRDTPETAVYKVDQLIKNIENNVANYKHQQRLGGKRVEAAGKKDPLGIR